MPPALGFKGVRYCPRCWTEQPDGPETCGNCGVRLVESLKSVEKAHGHAVEKLVVLAAFDNPMRAEILASRLEAEGIPAFLADAEMMSVNPLWSPALGGVKVQVREDDAERALEIMRETAPPAPGESAPACPHCGSGRTFREGYSWGWAVLAILLLGIPLLFESEKWKCSDCCRRFR